MTGHVMGHGLARALIAGAGAITIAGAMAACGALAACGDDSAGRADSAESAALAGDTSSAPDAPGTIVRTTELGPVSATVRVLPESPSLGDAITLILEVAAESGVTVDMPSFGEALGRFQIVQYVPREDIRGNTWIATQTYTLQAPMSGKQRIPPLRIEFVDERPGQTGAGGAQEILTDEIPLHVASVLPEGTVAAQLGAPREALSVHGRSLLGNIWLWLALALALAVGAALGVRAWREKARVRRRVSAYDVAMTRLARLEGRGLPEPEHADAWYVELSSIIRRYLEDRYSLRAPELTTEEFLHVARGSGYLSHEHRTLLSEFLIGCDRVKFARYEPRDEESRQALEAARSFLDDTRVQQAGAPAPSPARAPVEDGAS
jgi:hypothetical protein